MRQTRRLALALALLAVVGGLVAATVTVAQRSGTGRLTYLPALFKAEPETVPPAAILADLSIRPVPLREVQRGNTLSVEYRFRNDGPATATASLSLFFPSRLLSFVRLDASSDRLVSHDTTRVVVEVRNVPPGQTRTGRVVFLVFGSAPLGSRIGLFAEYVCRTGETCRSNLAEVEVIANGEEGSNAGTFLMSVSPDRGPPGTAHTFSGSGFRPGETFVTWLNTPTGVQALTLTGRADSLGRIRFTFGTGAITRAGFYSMVAHGQQSKVQNVGAFVVQINGLPALSLPAAFARAQAPAPPAVTAALPAQLAGEGGIAGRILDSAGAGLVGVAVEVFGPSGDLVAVTRSRTNGVYLVPTGLATGSYTVTAKPGIDPALAFYATTTVGAVGVTSPELTAEVNLTLPAAGGLTGVVKAGGVGLAGVQVAALGADGTVGAADLSDATGAYTLTHLPAGSYTLTFDPEGIDQAGLYDEAELPGQTVVAGQISPVADVSLSASATTGVIGGKVSAAAGGAGVGDVLVVITPVSPDPESAETFVNIATTAEDGTYTSDPLPAGDYRVQFVTLFSEAVTTTRLIGEFYNDAPTFAEADPVTVSAGQQATADAALAAGGSIAGSVSGEGAGALAEVVVAALDDGGVPRALDLTDAAGAYSLPGLAAGSYTIRAYPSLSPGSAGQTFADGGYDTTPAIPGLTPVTLEAGASLSGINITLSPGTPIVGTVTASDTGAPLSQVAVIFIGNPGTLPTLAGLALTDAAGKYTSPALGPGAYTIWFTTIFSSDPTSRNYQDEFFDNRASLDQADTIVVTDSLEPLTRDAALAPGGAVGGRVSAEDSGAGLAGVLVVASVGETVVGGALTDETGSYSLAGLPEGQVLITFDPSSSPDPAVRAYGGLAVEQEVAPGEEITLDVALGQV